MQLPLGLSQVTPCPYLAEQQEQLCFALCSKPEKQAYYPQLIELGFRRSGQELYRPHCSGCQACQSLRVDVNAFIPSRSQKRVLSKTKDLQLVWSKHLSNLDYCLFERYIEARHRDGSMYPTSEAAFHQFLSCDWADTQYLRLYQGDRLLALCVTDVFTNGLSAVYTFFEPELASLSLGSLAVLKQIEQAKQQKRRWLYLGYQVDDCRKMSYKQNYTPHQRFINDKWQ
ncbi:arginyltransferase [Agarivorans sp. Z349TD_8]|uniref:arginyltransferase n=1 Tax=Agarivorans sp. Z349TD_8 TaxID=3421434 RepID=UPI003D7E1AAC